MTMRKIIPFSKGAQEELNKLPKMYLVAFWAHYGVTDFPFSGKYEKRFDEKLGYTIDVPLVYQYDDHNGTCDDFFLRPIDYTTTGQIVVWTQDGYQAKQIANIYEEKYGRNYSKKDETKE